MLIPKKDQSLKTTTMVNTNWFKLCRNITKAHSLIVEQGFNNNFYFKEFLKKRHPVRDGSH